MPETLGTRLKNARRIRGLSQEQVAEMIGMHPVTISKYERDLQDPATNALKAMANLYGVSADWLLNGSLDSDKLMPSDDQPNLELVMAQPGIALRVAPGKLSEDAISDIADFTQLILAREERKERERGESG